MTTPSICGSFIGSKRALLAFTWTLTTILTLVAFFASIAFLVQINSHYRYLQRTHGDSSNNRFLKEDEHSQDEKRNSKDEEINWYPILARTSSGAITFVGVYFMFLSIAFQIYGSTAIVGFTSLKGAYIAPCFPNRNRLKIGIFGGAVVIFANLLLLVAVILGEFRVEDYRENQDEEDIPYAVERIATVLAVACMFLSIVYAAFSVVLFSAYASDPSSSSLHSDDDLRAKPLTDHRHQQFITIS